MDILNFMLTMAVFMLLFNGFIRLQTKRHLIQMNRVAEERSEPQRAPLQAPLQTPLPRVLSPTR